MNYPQLMKKLRSLSRPQEIERMARFGINIDNTFGISMPTLRIIGKEIIKEQGKDHKLALDLWKTGNLDARILASLIDDQEQITEKQMDSWVKDFNSWDVCDQTCMNLFSKTVHVYKKINKWSQRKEEYVKRAAFVLIAVLAVHDKKATDRDFEKLLPLIKKHSNDERNFVRKAVNWALRQIGKRNPELNKLAIKTAREIAEIDSKAARWIAADALRELQSKNVNIRLNNK
jgi:3-methyladenine DNA glycosylase AlkD